MQACNTSMYSGPVAGIPYTNASVRWGYAARIGLPMTLQITARVTWTGKLHTTRSLTDPYGLSGYLHRGTYIAFRLFKSTDRTDMI